jgi:hypothetical protein
MMGGFFMSMASTQQDPVAHEAWLEESLDVSEAAKFLNLEEQWLNRARMTGNGPPYSRAGHRLITYVRRDLIAWRDSKKHKSTAEYQRDAADGSTSTTSDGEG